MNDPTRDPEIRAFMDETLAAIKRGELQPAKVPWWWEPRRAGEMTPEYLGRVLADIGLVDLAERARLGHFDDFHAPDDVADGFELVHLVVELRREAAKPGHPHDRARLRDRIAAVENAVRRGEFDATKAESDRWAASKAGQDTFAELLTSARGSSSAGKIGRNAPCPCGSGLKFKRCHGGSR